MIEQEKLRKLIAFKCSPLLDMALSLLVLQNPERFGRPAAWAFQVMEQLPPALLEGLRQSAERVDLFGLAMELEADGLSATEALQRLRAHQPQLGQELLSYWKVIAPQVGAWAGKLAESIMKEQARLDQMDPLAFICRFSDRVSVAGDGEAITLHWGKGMRIPLADLDRILFVPSLFCPRRLMFYRLGPIQIFFYATGNQEPLPDEEAPESMLLGLSALSDQTRLRLLRLIAGESLPAQEMAKQLGVGESTVSRHLKLLTEAGLVGRDRQEGKFIFYSLERPAIDRLLGHVMGYLGRER